MHLEEQALFIDTRDSRPDVATHSILASFQPTAMPQSSHNQSHNTPVVSNYGYTVAADYPHSPVQQTPTSYPRPAVGYPYMPHNPTLEEREACDNRMRAMNARRASIASNRPDVDSSTRRSEMKSGGTNTQSSHLPLPGTHIRPTTDHHSSEEEGEESNGPDTPYSPQRLLWQERAVGVPQVQDKQRPHPERKVSFGAYKYEPAQLDVPQISTESTRDEVPEPQGDDQVNTSPTSPAVHAEIQRVTYEFNSLVLGFTFPSNLKFVSPPSSEDYIPQLVHTPASKVLLEHNHKLEKLLEQLDAIESRGDTEVQRMRKQAVDRVIEAMEGLKRMQAMAWYNYIYEQRMAKA